MDFLALALEQGGFEDAEGEEIPFEILSAGNQVLGTSFVQKRPPDPQKAPGGESFDSLSPWTPTLNDQRGAAAAAPLWKLPKAVLTRGGMTPAAYSVTPPGFGVLDVLTERVQAPRARSEGLGQGKVRAAEIPLLGAIRRAERMTSFIQGTRRNLTVTLPEPVGESGGLTVDAVDRAVERDARRYDGASVFY